MHCTIENSEEATPIQSPRTRGKSGWKKWKEKLEGKGSSKSSGSSSSSSPEMKASMSSNRSNSSYSLRRKSISLGEAPPSFDLEQPKSDTEIEKRFLEVVDSMGLPNEEAKKRFMEQFSTAASKWMMIQMHAKASATVQSTIGDVKYYVERLREGDILFEQLQGLAVELRTQTLGWMEEFIRLNGIYHLNVVLVSTCGVFKHQYVPFVCV